MTTPSLASWFNRPYRKLELALGYRFRRQALLACALTHPSYRFETPGIESDNQRLEFLGDAVLGLMAAERLFKEQTDAEEGALTVARSRITSTRHLAEVAARIGLGEWLRMGRGERSTGGPERPSNLCDALEAIIGAAYLDGGPRAAQCVFDRLFEPSIPDRPEPRHNPKGALQELAQRLFKQQPVYRTVEESGPAHARRFTVEVAIGRRALARGEGPSKRQAEVEAALRALEALDPPAEPEAERQTER